MFATALVIKLCYMLSTLDLFLLLRPLTLYKQPSKIF